MPHVTVDGKLREECGVFGVYGKDLDVARLGYFGLFALQHRGQESAGLAVTNGHDIVTHKGEGLVAEVFDEASIARLSNTNSHIAVGHVRYSTAGGSGIVNCQPLVARYMKGHLALAHNGNLTNGNALRAELESHGSIFQTTSDTEVILNLIARHRMDGSEEALVRALGLVQGAFSLAICTRNQLIGVRDPHGFRPLCLGSLGTGYVLASESAAIEAVGGEFIRDIKPGELVIIGEHGARFRQYSESKSASCIFEYVYFARNDSTIDGLNVYEARTAMGRLLAQEHAVDADMVISVPDSGTSAAIGYALESGLPYGEGLVKNRYVGRTFIQPSQALRELKVRLKLTPNATVVRGKRIVIVDDSIVRGTTTQFLVKMLKQAGAKEVHVRVSCPPWISPCFFGVDTPSCEELVGSRLQVEEIRQMIGADSLGYLSLAGMLKAVDKAHNGFCLGCFDKNYPLDVTGQSRPAIPKNEEWGDIRG